MDVFAGAETDLQIGNTVWFGYTDVREGGMLAGYPPHHGFSEKIAMCRKIRFGVL